MQRSHYELSRAQWLFSALSILAACLLVAALALRIASEVNLAQWWAPVAISAGMGLADLGSGLVHWFADTWGRDDMPVIGRRLLVPFRVHHINPDDLARRPFVDANGDVAFIYLFPLATLLAMPASGSFAGPILVGGLALCGIGMWTNQIHQWAHTPRPPDLVCLLQRSGLILGHEAHARHHESPWDGDYCITTGWWNRPLEAIGFFRRMESTITGITGAQPRDDERQRSSKAF